MVTINNIASAGNRIKSKYGMNALKPIAPKVTTSNGVKQQTATSIVPMIDAINLFLYCCITN
jgi:hypothetical protein